MNNCLSDYIASKTREYLSSSSSTNLYHVIIKEVEKPIIEVTLESTGGNQTKAAKILGITRNTLRKKMEEFNIEY